MTCKKILHFKICYKNYMKLGLSVSTFCQLLLQDTVGVLFCA